MRKTNEAYVSECAKSHDCCEFNLLSIFAKAQWRLSVPHCESATNQYLSCISHLRTRTYVVTTIFFANFLNFFLSPPSFLHYSPTASKNRFGTCGASEPILYLMGSPGKVLFCEKGKKGGHSSFVKPKWVSLLSSLRAIVLFCALCIYMK